MPMKFIKFVTLMLTTCSISFAHYDIRIDMFQNHQTFEKANCQAPKIRSSFKLAILLIGGR